MLLAIDTATRYASVALYQEEGVLSEQSWRSDNNHSVEVLSAIDAMLTRHELKPADLSAVAVAQGPGSFTGLRIGLSIAKGFCLALGIPILAIPTLDVMTYAVGDPGMPVYALLEAGRGRICVGEYGFAAGLPERRGELALVAEEAWWPEADGPILVAGEVSGSLADRLLTGPSAEEIVIPSLAGSLRRAGYLAELAWFRLEADEADDLDGLRPLYLSHPQ